MKQVVVLAILLLTPALLFSETIHVPDDHQTIQAAIDDSADGDTIIVRPGTYVENIVFNGKAITLQSEHGPEVTVIDGNQAGSVVTFDDGEGRETVLDGFTIRDGSLSGVFCGSNSSPTITGNIIADNDADFGGGIVCWTSSSPLISGNSIIGNTADTSGGGIYCDDSCSAQISDNTLTENSAMVGGGIFSVSDASSSISANSIVGNVASYGGGGICCYVNTSPLISDNSIMDNVADYGGGIYCSSGSFPNISDNTITNCTATDEGGGIFCRAASFPQITDSRIKDCSAESGGGVYCDLNSSPRLTDSSIMNCVASEDGGGIYCEFNSSPRISRNTITNCTAGMKGGGIYSTDNATPLISENSLLNNSAFAGGGIYSFNASPNILNNTVRWNSSSSYAGGISITGDIAHPPAMISGNRISNNVCHTDGGGVHLSFTTTTVRNNVITENRATTRYGGGIVCTSNTDVLIDNNTIAGNSANLGGGAIGGVLGATITVVDTILWGNTATTGEELSLTDDSVISISYCDVDGGQDSMAVESGSILNLGAGMIDADPLFAAMGKEGFYLSQIDAGQSSNSPCVAAGDPAGLMIGGTTRTDQVPAVSCDMGYYYPGLACLVVGPGPQSDNPPLVHVFPLEFMAAAEYEFNAYGQQQYGVNVSCGDLDGDLRDEILTGAGPGESCGPQVRGFDINGDPLLGLNFLAYLTKGYGVKVAAGDLDADGFDEIITGAGPGAGIGACVRAYDYDGGSSVRLVIGVNFFAYGTPSWGVNVSAGDLDGDGFDEIVTGPGPGTMYGPHVRGWDVDGGPVSQMDGVGFLAYGTKNYGVNVACGDIDGDGIDEIVTGPGPGAVFGAHVRGWNVDGGATTPIANLSFFAWPAAELRYGANVFSGADLNGNGRDEIVVGQGPDPEAGTWVKVYLYDGSQTIEWLTLDAYGDMGMTHGANVAAGHF